MKMKKYVLWFFFLTLLSINPSGATETLKSSTEMQSLRFDWQPGMMADVKVHVKGSRSVPPEGKSTWDFSGNYELAVEKGQDSLLVQRKNFSGWKGKTPGRMTAAVDRLVDLIPTLVVTNQGEFIGIEQGKLARSNFANMAKQSGGLSKSEQQMFENATSNSGMKAIAQDYWSLLVQRWHGFSAPIGEVVRTRHKTSVPQLGGGTIDIVTTSVKLGRVPCYENSIVKKCIELNIESSPDKSQVQEIINKMVMPSAPAGTVITRFDVVQNLTIITEPDTLKPYYMKLTRKSNADYSVKGFSQLLKTSEENERVYSFRYVPQK